MRSWFFNHNEREVAPSYLSKKCVKGGDIQADPVSKLVNLGSDSNRPGQAGPAQAWPGLAYGGAEEARPIGP